MYSPFYVCGGIWRCLWEDWRLHAMFWREVLRWSRLRQEAVRPRLRPQSRLKTSHHRPRSTIVCRRAMGRLEARAVRHPLAAEQPGTSLPDGSEGDDAATTASAAAEAVVPGISAATTAARTAIESTWTAYETVTNTADEIEKLNSDGDQVVLSATLEGKGKIGVGAKGRYGYDITVQQVGNSQTPGVADDANVQYEVSFSKNLLAGASFEPPVPYIDVEAELNFHSADTVTMRFETREEAAEAARILQRTALAETVRDAGSLAASAASPLPGGDVTSNPRRQSSDGRWHQFDFAPAHRSDLGSRIRPIRARCRRAWADARRAGLSSGQHCQLQHDPWRAGAEQVQGKPARRARL